MSTKVKRSSSFSEGDRLHKGKRRSAGDVQSIPNGRLRTKRRSRKSRSQTDVSRRRQSAGADDQNRREEAAGSRRSIERVDDAVRWRRRCDDVKMAAAGLLRQKVTFTSHALQGRRHSESESDRYESCADDDDDSETEYGSSSEEEGDELDPSWSHWITLAKRSGVLQAPPTSGMLEVSQKKRPALIRYSGQSAGGDGVISAQAPSQSGPVKRPKKTGFFRRLFGGYTKKGKDKKEGEADELAEVTRRPQRFPSPPRRKAPEIDPESRRKAIEVHVAGTRHETVKHPDVEEKDVEADLEKSKEESHDDLDELLDSMSTSTVSKASSSVPMTSVRRSQSPERRRRPMIVRVNERKLASPPRDSARASSPLASTRIPGPDPVLVSSHKYIPGGSRPMTSTHVALNDRSPVGKKLACSITKAARSAGISPALLKKLCADSKEIDIKQKEGSPTVAGTNSPTPPRTVSSGAGSLDTVIANPKFLKQTISDLTSLDGFSDIPIYECRQVVEEQKAENVTTRRRYGQGNEQDGTFQRAGSEEGSALRLGCGGRGGGGGIDRRRSLMLRQLNLKSLMVGNLTDGSKGTSKIVIEDFDNDAGKAVQTFSWVESQALVRRHRKSGSPSSQEARSSQYDDGKTIVSSADSGYSSGDVVVNNSNGRRNTDLSPKQLNQQQCSASLPNHCIRTSSVII
eukprot:m.309927 g.309927  ORF g.309927 m.309927 type:complete len:686 (+) comp48590_c0_seq1:326-2383(+)